MSDTGTANEAQFKAAPADPGKVEVSAQIDFFAPGEGVKVVIHGEGDNATWVMVDQVMSEGKRKQFLNAQSKMATITKEGDQRVPMTPGTIRTELILASVIDWNVIKDGRPFTFSRDHLKQFIEVMPTTAAKVIEDEVMRLNPGLAGDASKEDLEATIEECQRQLAELEEREGKENT